MSKTREILTLQFGHYSNFVGTHFWNFQEQSFNYTEPELELNHDVLFREGQTSKAEVTYTPRLLLVDLKGSLKHLSQYGNWYENEENSDSVEIWPESQVEIKKEESIKKNTYQKSLDAGVSITDQQYKNLENEVKVWSDFLYSKFHPRTINVVNQYQHENEKLPFNTYPTGEQLWHTDYFQNDFEDKIRLYCEECDSIQGFQILFDSNDAFSGLASSCIASIRDDYENKSILCLPMLQSNFNTKNTNVLRNNLIGQINTAIAISKIYETCSLIVPMSIDENGWRDSKKRIFKHINYNHESNYHTSAILATAFDTFSLRFRNKISNEQSYLFHMCNDLNYSGRKIVASSLGFPFPIQEKEDLIDCLNNWEGPLWESLTPRCKINTDRCLQTITLRGLPETKLKQPPTVNSRQREMPAYKCKTVKEMMEFYLSCISYATVSHVTTISKPLPVNIPFPNIFTSNININGYISNIQRPINECVKNVPILAGLHSNNNIGEMLEILHRETSRLKIINFNEFLTAGLEIEEYKALLEEILNIREHYIDEHFL